MNRLLLPVAAITMCASMFALQSCGENSATDSADPAAPDSVEAPKFDLSTPDGAAQSRFAHMRNDNIDALVKDALSKEQFAKISAKWDETRAIEMGAMEKSMFEKQLEKITSGAFIDEIMPMVESQLHNTSAEELSAQLATMAPFLTVMISNPELKFSEKQQEELLKVVTGLIAWVKTSDVANPETARSALKVVQATVMKLKLTTLDAAQELDIDQVLAKANIVSAGIKEILSTYKLDANEILDSVVVKKVSEDGDTAKIEMTVKAFGGEFTIPSDLTKVNGIWMDSASVEKINEFFNNL